MKKLYSLFAAVVIAATVSAQGTEGFSSQANTTGTNYTTVNFTGMDNTTWALALARIVDTSANYAITGSTALMNANGTITITFGSGVGNLKFQYMKAFTGGTARSIQVSVNGTIVNTTPTFGSGSGAQTTVYDYSYDINSSGSTVVEVKVLGAQTSLDNFVWTAAPTMSVTDINAAKASLVKNTLVNNTINFAAKADVKIVNMNGQVVKTASVNENTTLDVSALTKGTYIVTGVVNGKAVSEKVIKK
ncbi:T9SS type A sorting domain-containing protein [Chryseobacterium suipulveris]|uniref:T9SS type A sorting domain-containing protein n=1 Tax=Chryseobacterium suipulveris TaxID=2929800 RepID=A0ABY4BS35_9FLAO|nr:T9SS type A sorting domain-containing protein [Chryseobacterium suipulveris]UOE41724.1 T9SS type A sorting domain-containing protein [Chryseobacterium suipulveris]